MTESHVAVSATGLLADFNRAGALTWADVHPAQQLGKGAGRSVTAQPGRVFAVGVPQQQPRLGGVG